MTILLLGCGNVGANVARQLVARHPELDYVVADLNLGSAEKLAAELGGKVRAAKADVLDPACLDALFDGVDLVFNAVGPFYRSAVPVIEAALRARVDYIDINDDHDVAETLFLDPSFQQRALDAGIKLIIGCGSTPGLSNVIAKMLVDRLDVAREIHLATAVPFVPDLLSPAVIDHMMHITCGEVQQFVDGQYRKMPGWGGRLEVPYAAPFKAYPAYFIGHGETVTLPHFIKGLEQVTNRLGFFPEAGSEIWRSMIDLGLGRTEVIEGLGISPLKFLTHHLSSEVGRQSLCLDLSNEPWAVAMRVEVRGLRNGAEVCSVIEQHLQLPVEETEDSTADPTPTCARLFIEAYLAGQVSGQGLLAAESSVDAEAYVRAFAEQTGATFIASETQIQRDLYA
ncbi:saccharopine dehydrogenase family protein [Pseudomonas panipatensis]|uniref:Saccharopine dehydrogenase (NAD+, L-lysine forming) n=1 Tax=Pseudomonas panipatensis TaxID=428992 RepID=A0A1G8ELU0_9PSED|nr:saccharopine dehydrogenase NADP-binding domain-containing protein [Pseudomonas panipatensis]SDH70828.1 saccharopine dehydrogenase (NAD+, L-lysine forming) [Pseudomonas panipatensis]SMP68345.1 saccharopine dehydrogenase (NAD+, L-lysine forming) [Pseudomonas panipatensis]